MKKVVFADTFIISNLFGWKKDTFVTIPFQLIVQVVWFYFLHTILGEKTDILSMQSIAINTSSILYKRGERGCSFFL